MTCLSRRLGRKDASCALNIRTRQITQLVNVARSGLRSLPGPSRSLSPFIYSFIYPTAWPLISLPRSFGLNLVVCSLFHHVLALFLRVSSLCFGFCVRLSLLLLLALLFFGSSALFTCGISPSCAFSFYSCPCFVGLVFSASVRIYQVISSFLATFVSSSFPPRLPNSKVILASFPFRALVSSSLLCAYLLKSHLHSLFFRVPFSDCVQFCALTKGSTFSV